MDRAVSTLVGRADLRVAAFGETGLSQDDAGHDRRHSAAWPWSRPAFERRTYLGAEAFGPGDPLPPPVTIAGIDPAAEATLHDLTLRDGSALTGAANDALVNATLAREDGLAVGDVIDLETIDAPVHLRVVGILAGDGPWAGGGGRAVIVPLETAQAAFAADGLTRVDIGTSVARPR